MRVAARVPPAVKGGAFGDGGSWNGSPQSVRIPSRVQWCPLIITPCLLILPLPLTRKRWPLRLSAHWDQEAMPAVPPPPKPHIVQAFTSILHWIFVQQPTLSSLSHQIPVPAPRLALLSPPLLRGHSSQKRSPHAPASRVSTPDSLSPINASSSSFLSEPHLGVGVPQVP